MRDYPQLHSTVDASTEIISPPNITLLFWNLTFETKEENEDMKEQQKGDFSTWKYAAILGHFLKW